MGSQYMQGMADAAEEGLISREQALEVHIRSNFYPPHPEFVVKSMLEGFRKYWAGKINVEALMKKCYLRDLEGLYRYFSSFLNEENED